MATHSRELEKIAAVFPIINELKDRDMADKIAKIWIKILTESNWGKLEDACFSPKVKNQRLVDHVNTVTNASLKVSEVIEQYQQIKFSRDLIIIIGLLHDVSKLLEYEPDGHGGCQKSDIGHKIQHGVMGAIYVYNMGLSLDVVHLVLTHTPYSKISPAMKEGILFSCVDLCDADMIAWENGLPLFARDEVVLK